MWRNNYFGNPSNVGAGANGASPAGDGVPNLIKYALGLNPFTPATAAQLPSGSIQPDGGTNYLTLTVNRAADPSDITYIVEVSSNLLSGWVSGPPNTVTLTNTPRNWSFATTRPCRLRPTGLFVCVSPIPEAKELGRVRPVCAFRLSASISTR